jgi:Tol biopolymer transport system component
MHRPTISKIVATCILLSSLSSVAQQFSAWSTPVNLASLNTPATDGCPALSRDGLSLYFASSRAGGAGGLDLYVTHRDSLEDDWGVPENLGPTLNTASDEFCPGLSTDGHLLFFASNRAGGCGGRDIYVSRRQNKREDFGDGGWGPPQNLGCTVNSAKDEFGANYSEAGGVATLYFNSNRDGGSGGQDIYAAARVGDDNLGMPTFDTPMPVTRLNSGSNDQQPAMRRDGLEVIFASDRPGGLGALDLWVATRASTSDAWSTPEDLGAAVNSGAADQRPALSWDGTELYFGSRARMQPDGTVSTDQDLYVSKRNKLHSD